MAGPSTTTRSTFSFKKLVGKAHTSNATPFFSEGIPSQISVDVGDILGEEIPTDPQVGVNNNVVEYVELELSEITASNGLSFNIQFPSTYSGVFGTGVQGDNVRLHTQIVDQKNNLSGKVDPSHTGGYVYDLEDGTGTTIPSGAAENWILDPVAGIITSEQEIAELTNNGGTVGAYIYTGSTLDQVISQVGVDIEDDGVVVASSVPNINFGTGLNVSGDGDGSVTATVELGDFTTDDLPEGSTNLYFTDGRVDDRLNEIRPAFQDAFSGDGTATEFQIVHGLSVTPAAWLVTPATDDASGFSHVTADDTYLYVSYDTPPPSGTGNVVINWTASGVGTTASPTFQTTDDLNFSKQVTTGGSIDNNLPYFEDTDDVLLVKNEAPQWEDRDDVVARV